MTETLNELKKSGSEWKGSMDFLGKPKQAPGRIVISKGSIRLCQRQWKYHQAIVSFSDDCSILGLQTFIADKFHGKSVLPSDVSFFTKPRAILDHVAKLPDYQLLNCDNESDKVQVLLNQLANNSKTGASEEDVRYGSHLNASISSDALWTVLKIRIQYEPEALMNQKPSAIAHVPTLYYDITPYYSLTVGDHTTIRYGVRLDSTVIDRTCPLLKKEDMNRRTLTDRNSTDNLSK
jgi:hypothetical protein